MESRFLCLLFLLLLPVSASETFDPNDDFAFEMTKPKILVKGHVVCDQCAHGYVGKMTIPLHDAEVGVKCLDLYGFVTFSGVGYTDTHGVFTIAMDEIPAIFGIKGCKAKLLRGPSSASCNVVSTMGEGHSGAPLHLMHKSLREVIFTAGPFSCRPLKLPKVCKPSLPPPPPYWYISPPPPSPQVHVYKSSSPPPPPPVHIYRSYSSPPPPAHVGHPPPSAVPSYHAHTPPPSPLAAHSHPPPPPPAAASHTPPPPVYHRLPPPEAVSPVTASPPFWHKYPTPPPLDKSPHPGPTFPPPPSRPINVPPAHPLYSPPPPKPHSPPPSSKPLPPVTSPPPRPVLVYHSPPPPLSRSTPPFHVSPSKPPVSHVPPPAGHAPYKYASPPPPSKSQEWEFGVRRGKTALDEIELLPDNNMND